MLSTFVTNVKQCYASNKKMFAAAFAFLKNSPQSGRNAVKGANRDIEPQLTRQTQE
jgi:hypothetical protein